MNYKSVIQAMLNQLSLAESTARQESLCLRKHVGVSIVRLSNSGGGRMFPISMGFNGPSRKDHLCSNQVGNCGCSHSEPRAIRSAYCSLHDEVLHELFKKPKLVLLCNYSPCTNCANVILDSGIIGGVVYKIVTEHDQRGLKYLLDAVPVLTTDELYACLNYKFKEGEGHLKSQNNSTVMRFIDELTCI